MSDKWVVADMRGRLVKRTATSTGILVSDADGEWWLVAEFNGNGHYAKAERAVACVNACAGMDDPAKVIADLREQNAAMRKALEEIIDLMPRFEARAKEISGAVNGVIADSLCNSASYLREIARAALAATEAGL